MFRCYFISTRREFYGNFSTLSVVIWFSTGTLEIFATLVYVFTMRVVIYDILSMAIICAIYYCEFHHAVWLKSPYGYIKFCNIDTQKKLIHCMAIFTILYGNYYPSHGELKLICIGKFARRTWVHFTQQYGKNRQSCQQNKFYYAVWQLLLYYYREFLLL